MKRIKIIADDKIPYLKGVLEPYADMEYYPGRKISPEIIRSADAIISRTRTRCDETLLKGSNVKFIASATIGFDHIDTEFCDRAGIEWTNAPGCNSSSVEQYIVSALLHLGKVRKMNLNEKTLGVIGVGHVGSKVSRAAEILGMKVIKNDPPRARMEKEHDFVELSEVLSESDIITLHVPLNRSGIDKTDHMVDRRFIEAMKQGAVLINSSRGQVTDDEAVKEGIRLGKLSDIIQDVFNNEPEIDKELVSCASLVTPHIAGYSVDGKANGTMMSVQAVSHFFNFGLENWVPENLPVPENHELYLDASGSDIQNMLWEVFMQTYDIRKDDEALRGNPEMFESLRENYPQRREPSSYAVKVFNGESGIFGKLEGLGFSLIGDSCF